MYWWVAHILTHVHIHVGAKSRSLWVLNTLTSNYLCQTTFRLVMIIPLNVKSILQANLCLFIANFNTCTSKVTSTILLVNMSCWITTHSFLLKWNFPFPSLKPLINSSNAVLHPVKPSVTDWILYLIPQKWKPCEVPFSKKSQEISRWIINRISTQGIYISELLRTHLYFSSLI